MRSALLSTILMFAAFNAQAQITLNQSDLPSVGENWVLYSDS
jgi:hypothetical protein